MSPVPSFLTNQRKHTSYNSTYLDVLLGVLQVLKQSVLSPDDTTLLVGGTVGVSIGLAGLTTKESVKIGALLVGTSFLNSVALRTLGLENLGSLLGAHGVRLLVLDK